MNFPSEFSCEGTACMSNAFLIISNIRVGGCSEEGYAGVGFAAGWRGVWTCPFGADGPERSSRVIAFFADGGGTHRAGVEGGAGEAHGCE